MNKTFMTRMSKEALSEILSSFFRKTGYIERNVSVEVEDIVTEENDLIIEGSVKEEAIN